jgi:hypothetical protein
MIRRYISVKTDTETHRIHGESISVICKRFKGQNALATIHKEERTKTGWQELKAVEIGNIQQGITNAQYYGAKERLK